MHCKDTKTEYRWSCPKYVYKRSLKPAKNNKRAKEDNEVVMKLRPTLLGTGLKPGSSSVVNN